MTVMSIDRFPGLYDSESVRGWRFLKAIFFFLIGSGMLLWMLFRSSPSGAELQKNGVQVEGKVTDTYLSRKGKEKISYYFVVNGRRVSIDQRTVADLEGVARLGPITVWYDPEDPQRCTTPNEIRDESAWKKILPVAIIVLMITLSGYHIYATLWHGH